MKSQAAKLRRLKGRGGEKFAAFPTQCQRHPSYIRLSVTAKALLHELNQQYNGSNNGDLCTAWNIVKGLGLAKSRTTIDKARDELELVGWIVQTRQGGRNSPNLYALTFREVDDCKGKLDSGALEGTRYDYWKQGTNPMLAWRLRPPRRSA